jgi:hypothetical protein
MQKLELAVEAVTKDVQLQSGLLLRGFYQLAILFHLHHNGDCHATVV